MVEAQVRGLHSLGVTPESYGSLLTPVLMSKLPCEICLAMSREVSDEDWELEKLLKTLERELCARERATVNVTAPPKKPRPSIPPTATTLLTEDVNAKPACCYCQQSHYSSSCKEVVLPERRKAILRSAGRCFVCLKRGHVGRTCRSSARCSICHGRHHVSICKGRTASTTNSRTDDQCLDKQPLPPPANSESSMNLAAPPFNPSKSLTLWTCANQTILLQTAQAVVFNPDDPHRSAKVRVIFDLGSQRSYITERLKQELALCKVGEQGMSIMTFGLRGQSNVCVRC